jgi:hypothetical protein
MMPLLILILLLLLLSQTFLIPLYPSKAPQTSIANVGGSLSFCQ